MIAAFILELEAKGESCHPSPGLIMAALKRIERMLKDMDQRIIDAFAAARDAAAQEHNAVVAVVGLLTSVESQLQAALASGNSAEEIVTQISQITQAISSDKETLAAAVAQGTPAEVAPTAGNNPTPTPAPGTGSGDPPAGDATDPTS